MEAPRRYSVSPLHSFVTVPSHRATSFSEMLAQVWRWLTNRHPTPTLQQRFAEARLVERLAEELEENGETRQDETRPDDGSVPRDKFLALRTLDSSQDGDQRGIPPIAPKRDRRVR
jgi:hypothetical protein